jgi:Gram-negative porin
LRNRLVWRSARITNSRALALLVFLWTALSALPAHAEVELFKGKEWTLSTDGRVNAFLSIARGDAIPSGEASFTGLDEEATPDQKIESARVRTGFIESVLAFTLKKQLEQNVTATARVALWMLASSQRTWGDEPSASAREAYLKIDAPWGGFLAGRAMSLFSRGAILLDYDLEHNYGLGHPCGTKVVAGGSCGHSGFGVLFPGFHAGLVYNTPTLAGLQLSAGLYDPAQIGEGLYRRTPLPRVEAELTYRLPDHFRAFAGTLWQRLSRNQTDTTTMAISKQNQDASGLNYGFMVDVSPLAFGFSGYLGKGLGLYTPLEDNPFTNLEPSGVLRKQNGYYGAASLTFGQTKFAAGLGISRLQRAPDDPEDSGDSKVPKQQVGMSAGVYQGLYKTVVVALEVFRAQTTWYNHGEPVGADTAIIRPVQTVNFFNAGATLVW